MVFAFRYKWTFRTMEHIFGFDMHLKLVERIYIKILFAWVFTNFSTSLIVFDEKINFILKNHKNKSSKTFGLGIYQIRFSWQLMLSVLLSKLIISTFEWIQKSSLVPRTNSHCLHLKTSTSPSPCELTFCTRIPWNNYKRKLISDLSFKSISTLHMFGLLNFYLVIIQILWN